MESWQLWAIGLAVAIVGVWATWRFGNRRKRLTYNLIAVPLVTPGLQGERVTVTVGETVMMTPHSVRVSFTNTGPQDVRPEDFPKTLGRFNIAGCTKMGPLRGELRRRGESEAASSIGGGGGADPTLWEFERVHIPRGATATFTGVVDGDPTDVTLADLYDVDVTRESLPRGMWGGLLLGTAATAGIVTAVVLGLTETVDGPGIIAILAATAALWILGVLRIYRRVIAGSHGWVRLDRV